MTLEWRELYSQLILAAREKKEFISASFELTPRCNLRCKMCYLCRPANDKEAKAKELTTAQWIRLGEEARDAGLLFLTLTGGEVFLREDFKILYEKFMNLGLIIKVFTNGTLITPEIVNWLAAMPPSKVSISVYGASPETYKKVTGWAEGFDKTIRAIDMLLDKGIQTEIKTTVVKGNRHDSRCLLDLARERNLGLGIVNYISPGREACYTDPIGNRLTSEELLQYEIEISEREKELINADNFEEKSRLIDAVADEATDLHQYDESKMTENAFECTAGSCAGWIAWDGRLLPCGLLDVPETNPLENGFLPAWEELKRQCALIPVCEECRQCQYRSCCEHCPARLYRETGYYDRPASYLCELAKSRTEYKKRKGEYINYRNKKK